MTHSTFDQAAVEAAAYLREDAPRTPAEQDAFNAIRNRLWMLLHADDYATGVVLVLSRAGLLRDRAEERRQDAADRLQAASAERTRTADQVALGRLYCLAGEGADRLDAGEEPAAVAAWLRKMRDAILDAQERATAGRETP